jgi:hypothetical protein
VKPDAFGYGWWYKALRSMCQRDEPVVETPLHPDVKGFRRDREYSKSIERLRWQGVLP